MAPSLCPGQDKRFWKGNDASDQPCPRCGNSIEFWKDDFRRRCTHCGERVRNARFDMGCAKWCQFAEQCVGIPAAQLRDETLCDALIKEMKQVFADDQRRIRHALAVLDCAELILKQEKADPLVVKAAAVLHDIGIHEAEAKHGSAAGNYQEIEGPPIARRILSAMQVDPAAGRPRVPDHRQPPQCPRHRHPRVPHPLGCGLAGEHSGRVPASLAIPDGSDYRSGVQDRCRKAPG